MTQLLASTKARSSVVSTLVTVVMALVVAGCGDDSAGNAGTAALPECLTFEDLYSLTGSESEGFDNWLDGQELADELGSTTELPDAELSITAPGEESGTYGSYIEIVLEGIGETRVDEGHIEEDDAATTRKDYDPSADDNVIVDAIAGADGSLGWVGFGFADANRERVRSFAIDGGDGCVEPTPETIADFSYPISRPLFIYVATEAATSDPAVAAFVDFYLSDEGRVFAEDGGYIPLTAEQWEETQAAWEALGVSAPDNDVEGSVTISGSSTVEPITGLAAERFNAQQPGVGISVAGPGTSDGFAQFCNGEIPIADASRTIAEEEIAQCEAAGIDFVELQIAIDGLSVITKG